jgi:predicted nucleic acid-binding protein
MIVLDTNVLSEALRPVPEPSVLDWSENQSRAQPAKDRIGTYGIRFSAMRAAFVARPAVAELFDMAINSPANIKRVRLTFMAARVGNGRVKSLDRA